MLPRQTKMAAEMLHGHLRRQNRRRRGVLEKKWLGGLPGKLDSIEAQEKRRRRNGEKKGREGVEKKEFPSPMSPCRFSTCKI